ncbi:MAG: DUF2946 family protein [Pelistega sp.]|nr:DUF2946 family protein [Pelistega sp.]
MDQSVLDAMAKWPNVPAAYGWLSLNQAGLWRFHPGGEYQRGVVGESITNPQLIEFIGRNYTHDERGCWFFQNGPQRVFVGLDATPWVAYLDEHLALRKQNASPIEIIEHWYIDEDGKLYASTPEGLVLIQGRDVQSLFDQFTLKQAPDAMPIALQEEHLMQVLEQGITLRLEHTNESYSAPFSAIKQAEIESIGGFVAVPTPEAIN